MINSGFSSALKTMPTNRHRSRHRGANSRLAKWWQCFVASSEISDSSDSEPEFFVENTTAVEYEDDPQPWPPPSLPNILLPLSPPRPGAPPPDNIVLPPPPPLFALELSPPSLGPSRVRNENSSPRLRTPAPPMLSLPTPPPQFGPRSIPSPIIHVDENSSTSSSFRFTPGGSPRDHFFPVAEPPPPVEVVQRLEEDTAVSSALIKVKISEDYKRDEPHCPICKEEYAVGEEAARLHCFHTFHSQCVLPWLDDHKTCPVCRTEVEAPPRDECEINILELGLTMEVPQPLNTVLEEEIEQNNNENVNSDEADIPDIEESHEAGDSNTAWDSDETGYNSACDEFDESHG